MLRGLCCERRIGMLDSRRRNLRLLDNLHLCRENDDSLLLFEVNKCFYRKVHMLLYHNLSFKN